MPNENKPEKGPKPVKPVKAPKAPKAPKKNPQVFERKEEESTVKGALARVGLYRRTGTSIVIHATKQTPATPERLWDVWSELEKWPTWDKGIVASARWLETRGWAVGNKFDVTYNWGYSKGKVTEIVREVVPGESAIWFQVSKGIMMFGKKMFSSKSCHIWFFEPQPEGGTKVSRTVVLVGTKVFFSKMFGARKKYTALFKASLDSLTRLAERTPS